MKANVLFIESIREGELVDLGKIDPIETGVYTHVADVEVGDDPCPQDVVWRIVQNVDSLWVDDPRVSLTPDGEAIRSANHLKTKERISGAKLENTGVRSMMVGDVVRSGEELWMCSSFGWKKLTLYGDHYIIED